MIKPGKLLVAHPDISDSYFEKSVILITEHHSQGTTGLVINQKSGNRVSDALSEYDYNWPWKDMIYFGGPIDKKSLFLLHTSDFSSSNTLLISSELSMSSDLLMTDKMLQGDVPMHYRFIVGQCSWAPRQLMNEINHENLWLTCNSNNRILFEYTNEKQWKKAIELCAEETMSQFF